MSASKNLPTATFFLHSPLDPWGNGHCPFTPPPWNHENNILSAWNFKNQLFS